MSSGPVDQAGSTAKTATHHSPRALLLLALLVGCDRDAASAPACPAGRVQGGLSQSLTFAATSSPYLLIGERQANAIVAVSAVDGTEVELTACSGVVVGSRWVLTAAHCMPVEAAAMNVRFGKDALASDDLVRSVSVRRHPRHDAMLIELSASIDQLSTAITPLAVAATHVGRGDLVEIVGFGVDEVGSAGKRRFLVSSVADRADSILTVSSGGYAGACVGDSGGPALARDATGRVTVVGILQRGSKSCVGADEYLASDALRDWTGEQAVDSQPPAAEPCGPIQASGRCFGATAVYCEHGEVVTTECAEGARCGWDEQAEGFRCTTDDPCQRLGELGSCRGGDAVRCVRGELIEQRCEACGEACTLAPHTGRAVCVGW